MSTVVVSRAATAAATSRSAARASGAHPKMLIICEGYKPFTVPYAPRDTQTDGLVPEWATVARGGREPLLLRSGGQLETLTFDLIVTHPESSVSIWRELSALSAIAESGGRIKLDFDTRSAKYLWRMTAFSTQVLARQHGTNQPTRAICTMTFTEVSDPVRAVSPTTGGTGGTITYTDKTRPKTYKWKKGDSMQKIAKRFYGTATLWDDLADYNKVTRANLKPGRIIKLPKRAALMTSVAYGPAYGLGGQTSIGFDPATGLNDTEVSYGPVVGLG